MGNSKRVIEQLLPEFTELGGDLQRFGGSSREVEAPGGSPPPEELAGGDWDDYRYWISVPVHRYYQALDVLGRADIPFHQMDVVGDLKSEHEHPQVGPALRLGFDIRQEMQAAGEALLDARLGPISSHFPGESD